MSTGALLFLLGSWTGVLGLTAWSFRRILRGGRRGDHSRE